MREDRHLARLWVLRDRCIASMGVGWWGSACCESEQADGDEHDSNERDRKCVQLVQRMGPCMEKAWGGTHLDDVGIGFQSE